MCVPLLPSRWSSQKLASVASMGRILLQHFLSVSTKDHTISGCLRHPPPPPTHTPQPPLISHTAGRAKVQAVDKQLIERDVLLWDIKERLCRAQDLMKQLYDAGHRAISFEVGGWVWLKLHHHHASEITKKSTGKLAPKFYGPFQVEEHIGSLSYHLALPPQTHIHNVFHMLFLKEVCRHATRKTSAAATYQTRSSSSSSTQGCSHSTQSGCMSTFGPVVGHSPADATWEYLSDFWTVLYSSLRTRCFVGSVIDAFVDIHISIGARIYPNSWVKRVMPQLLMVREISLNIGDWLDMLDSRTI